MIFNNLSRLVRALPSARTDGGRQVDEANQEKHGIAFRDAVGVFDAPT